VLEREIATLLAAPVNVNTASAEEIAQALNGIGKTKADIRL
jgi:DNA uptake protein ComE-like DNA-binding protein